MAETGPPGWEPPKRLRRRAKPPVNGRAPPPFINLCGDYRFLRGGYWALIDAELSGVRPAPTPLQAITAQNAAACLLVAAQAGIPCVEWRVVRKPQEVEPPALLVPVAGLTEASYSVRTRRSAPTQLRRASQNFTRSVLSVPLRGPVRSFKTITGLTASEEFDLAWRVWQTFGIPLGTVWYVEEPAEDRSGEPVQRFLGIDPLPLHELTQRELSLLEEVSTRPMSQS